MERVLALVMDPEGGRIGTKYIHAMPVDIPYNRSVKLLRSLPSPSDTMDEKRHSCSFNATANTSRLRRRIRSCSNANSRIFISSPDSASTTRLEPEVGNGTAVRASVLGWLTVPFFDRPSSRVSNRSLSRECASAFCISIFRTC